MTNYPPVDFSSAPDWMLKDLCKAGSTELRLKAVRELERRGIIKEGVPLSSVASATDHPHRRPGHEYHFPGEPGDRSDTIPTMATMQDDVERALRFVYEKFSTNLLTHIAAMPNATNLQREVALDVLDDRLPEGSRFQKESATAT